MLFLLSAGRRAESSHAHRAALPLSRSGRPALARSLDYKISRTLPRDGSLKKDNTACVENCPATLKLSTVRHRGTTTPASPPSAPVLCATRDDRMGAMRPVGERAPIRARPVEEWRRRHAPSPAVGWLYPCIIAYTYMVA